MLLNLYWDGWSCFEIKSIVQELGVKMIHWGLQWYFKQIEQIFPFIFDKVLLANLQSLDDVFDWQYTQVVFEQIKQNYIYFWGDLGVVGV